ncbi:uncharacterized protein LOC125449502 isoform X2 [Stegostoma tigrinum]|uniref:uncharacterized protein LOC125449502 isoform X2 n=1 Tax=Stegostoma tigrinum TaxID=3053191 RepID=UPI0028700C06|nr:uncharacterized protein LOC125449502 isoform X2 [Stegostoma tigrinum]
MGAAGAALLLHLLLLQKDQLQALSFNTITMTAIRGEALTFPGGPKSSPDSIEWTFKRAAGGDSTNICNWYRNNAVDCTAAYARRVQLHLNGSLTIWDLRIADSGWYHVIVIYGRLSIPDRSDPTFSHSWTVPFQVYFVVTVR